MTKETDFKIDENGIITRYIGSGGKVIIPAEIRGIPVREIGDQAFFLAHLLPISNRLNPSSVL